jgi:hypothetical protein
MKTPWTIRLDNNGQTQGQYVGLLFHLLAAGVTDDRFVIRVAKRNRNLLE